MTEFMIALSFLGSGYFLTGLALVALALFLIWKKPLRYVWLIAINLLLSSLVNEGLKNVFQKPRPNLNQLVAVTGYSFPSGHAMVSTAFYGLLIFLCITLMKHRAKYFFSGFLGLLILAIGLSRVYLGVHYLSDVLGGFAVGTAWVVLMITVYSCIFRAKRI